MYGENSIVRAGLESILRTDAGLEVVGSSSSIDTLVQLLEDAQPDVVLLQIWSISDDEPVLEKLLAQSTLPIVPAIVILTDNFENDWAALLRSGVRGILPLRASVNEIVTAVAAAGAGLVVLHPDFIEFLDRVAASSVRSLPNTPIEALTPREIEVLGMLAQGLGNKIIAKRLGISEHTVKFHVSSIFSKLNASTRTEAVALGARQGLIML